LPREKGQRVKILFIGDVIGRPGRWLVQSMLPRLRERHGIDFVIANGENASGGAGLAPSSADELFASGVNVITGGNHTFRNRQILDIIDTERRLLRPANMPSHPRVRGRGWEVYDLPGAGCLAVISLSGTVMMDTLDNPFHCADRLVSRLSEQTPNILVDFHAEATSEKVAMGWFLDGRVTAVLGSHTHVPTADQRVLPGGTAYITDAGMTGPFDSVIGVKKEIILEGFLSRMPVRHAVADGDLRLCGVVVEFNAESGRATGIERLMVSEKNLND
jgi:metallophosphoesterase (TIGR00282 family)